MQHHFHFFLDLAYFKYYNFPVPEGMFLYAGVCQSNTNCLEK